ncbi:MAG: hypothetical protein ACHQJ6_07550 [Candidatus Berkiellales bacterium]
MSNMLLKILLLTIGILGVNSMAWADWQNDCKAIESGPPAVQGACSTIQNQISELGTYIVPAPFFATTINQFPTTVFPNGSPWGSAAPSAPTNAVTEVVTPTTFGGGG